MVDFAVVPERTALLNVDMQNLFVQGYWPSAPDGPVILDRINRQAVGDHERGHDIAYIAIHRVIKNDLKDEPLQAGGHVQAKMCSSRNRVRVSTDIRYELGTAGIWLIAMANDGSLHIDKHPVQRQPQDRPFVMREVFSVDKHAAMVGRYTRTEWLQHRVSAGKDRPDPRR